MGIKGARIKEPWLCIGDFNDILVSHEKEWGKHKIFGKMQHFQNMVNQCGFIDLGFNGPKFTWSNKRDTQVHVWERLDRAFANAKWIRLYENYKVQHLPLVGSDRRPILLDTAPKVKVHRCFHFRAMWIRHESFLDQIKHSWMEQANGTPLFNLVHKIQTCEDDLKQ